VRLEDRIACTALPAPPPDLEVPPPATARCGPIWIFWGWFFILKDPLCLQASLTYVFAMCQGHFFGLVQIFAESRAHE